jgi:hypothetical protein
LVVVVSIKDAVGLRELLLEEVISLGKNRKNHGHAKMAEKI